MAGLLNKLKKAGDGGGDSPVPPPPPPTANAGGSAPPPPTPAPAPAAAPGGGEAKPGLFGGTAKPKTMEQQANPSEAPYEKLKEKIMQKVVEDMDPAIANEKNIDLKKEKLAKQIDSIAVEEGAKMNMAFNRKDHGKLVSEIINDMLFYGPMQPLLEDEDISEIMVNGPYQVYVEKKGKLTLTEIKFKDNDHVMRIIERIIAPIGRRCDESTPLCDARLKDGSRVNAVIPPVALNGPCLSIRKFKKEKLVVEDLVKFGTLTQEMSDFLKACVRVRLNIVVSGGTGSGKTTTLNILSSFIPDDERIITCEDAAELQIRKNHVVRLETRPKNIEGKGEIPMQALIINTLRMRAERVIVGECRGKEALDMLQAMNTGADGSLTTGHANTPRDMIARLETMVLMAGYDLPVRAIREQISSAIQMIVQQSRLKDGTRKITYITEVQGMEGDKVVLQDIFIFEQKGVDSNGKIIGRLKPTGIRPSFMEKIERSGIKLPANIFMDTQAGW